MRYLHFFILLLLAQQNTCAQTYEFVEDFSMNDVYIDSIVADDSSVFSIVRMAHLDNEGEPGAPSFPVKHITVDLPHTASNIAIESLCLGENEILLNRRHYPHQPETPAYFEYTNNFVGCNETIYDSSEPFPRSNVSIEDISCSGDGSKHVHISVCPFLYFPSSNIVKQYTSIKIIVNYTSTIRTSIANNEDIGIPFYEYCIITNENLKDSFTRLAAWKRTKGVDAGIITIEDIVSNEQIMGDEISHIYDDAGKIRQYLQYAYNSGKTKYVLFGGDSSILPIRYGTGVENNSDTEFQIPSDLYFSDLNTNWNTDNDDYLGENHGCDYGAELYVGRLLCTCPEDVDNYTDKLLKYEINPGKGDYMYLGKALFTEADQMQRDQQASIVASVMPDSYYEFTTISEEPSYDSSNTTFPTGKDVIDEMNNIYGYISIMGHGHPNGIATKQDFYQDNTYGIGSVSGDIAYLHPEEGNGLDRVNNGDFPAFFYSIACTIIPFDEFDPVYVYPNIGKSWTSGKGYGGPGLVGNTRYGYVSHSYKIQSLFNQKMAEFSVGKALAIAKEMVASSMKHYLAHSTNLIGCPEYHIWGIPQLINCNYNNGMLSLSVNDITTVCRRHISGSSDIITLEQIESSRGNVNLPVYDNCITTLTAKNYLPMITPCYINNIDFVSNQYLFVNDIFICTENRGDVTITAESDLTIEKKGRLKLDKGFKIEKGASFKVTTSSCM